jgi:hypothetical protein
MGLLDADAEEPRSKVIRYTVSGVVLAMLLALGLWFIFRFTPEKMAVERFMNALVAGDTQQAFKIWNPHGDFTYADFLNFWGPKGYYSPIKSYQVERMHLPSDGSGVVVVVALSGEPSFPSTSDAIKTAQTREVEIWVERSDHSMSFPPP